MGCMENTDFVVYTPFEKLKKNLRIPKIIPYILHNYLKYNFPEPVLDL